MKIAILSRNARLYSTRRLTETARARGHVVRVLDPLRCYMRIAPGAMQLRYKGKPLCEIDAVIPRTGVRSTSHGVAVLRQLEMMGVYTPNSSEAVLCARDKLRSLQILAAQGLNMPVTVFGDNPDDTDDLLAMLGDPPHVIKLNEGNHGRGVVLAEKHAASKSVIEAFRGLYANFLVQNYVTWANGCDLRCFVVDGRVVAAMQRMARPGEFRANLHCGGSACVVVPSATEKRVAERAAKALGLGMAGVDLLRARSGPLLLEVNASPGLEGIEKTTGVDISACIIQHLELKLSHGLD